MSCCMVNSIQRNLPLTVNCTLSALRSYSHTATDKDVTKLEKDKGLLRKTPLGKLDEFTGKHPYEEKEPLPEFKDGVNPSTGEIGGPKGPEPTRYGDWERKGRVSDF